MKLEKIISLANKNSEIRFLAMIRSLRATGCNLPVWVIPYDDNKFELPENCIWWEMGEVIGWLEANHAHKMMRKYQCLLTENYQYVDSDVVFLRNPEIALSGYAGFITSCGHWHNPGHTYIEPLVKYYKEKTTTWQKDRFNAGQYACDTRLFRDLVSLKRFVEDPRYKEVCLNYKTYDQVALNLLIHLSDVQVTNITLPPHNVESTWAGDYTDHNFERYWNDEEKKPYIIHWAGCEMNNDRPINNLFINYLSESEKKKWNDQLLNPGNVSIYKKLRRKVSLLKQAIQSFKRIMHQR